MKTFFSVLGIVILIVIVGFILKIVLFPAKVLENTIQTGYDAIDKTINADNAIYNYEWFKQQYEDIQAMKNKYKNSEVAFDSYLGIIDGEKTFEDKTEIARLNSVKLGIQNQLEQMIADYNARSKMATRNIFINSVLPDYIDSLTFIKQ